MANLLWFGGVSIPSEIFSATDKASNKEKCWKTIPIPAFLASLGSTSMIIVNQKMSIKGISPIPINIFINVFNTFFFFVILKIFFSLNFNFDINIYLLILIPSVCYSFALLSQLIAIPKIGQSYTALFLYLEPVVGVLGAVFLLKENLETYQMIGASIVIISLLSASFISRRN